MAFVISGCSGTNDAGAALENAFTNPPEETRPWVYWYWLNDNISKEGITKDLEAMKAVGIGEALIGNVKDPSSSYGSVEALSDEWWDCVEFAVQEAARLGMKVGLFNCPGWSQSGGPWISWDESMHYLATSEKKVKGGHEVKVEFEIPEEEFEVVSVRAFPAPKDDGVYMAGVKILKSAGLRHPEALFDGDSDTMADILGYPASVEFAAAETFAARSIEISPGDIEMCAVMTLEYSDPETGWTEIASREINRNSLFRNVGPEVYAPVTDAFRRVDADKFRLTLTKGRIPFEKTGNIEGRLAEIRIGSGAIVSHSPEKQLAKMYPASAVQPDSYVWDEPVEPENKEYTVNPDDIIDLTDQADSSGSLAWNVPEGDWIVQRVISLNTGAKNLPVTPAAEGYEVDKMSSKAVRHHFDAYAGRLLDSLSSEEKSALAHVVADSYETGSQNWTPGFREEFISEYGYDPMPWLPVLSGRIVGSADCSDRFLWDYRRLIADMIARNYVGGLRETCNENGLELWIENYGHWGFPGEFLNYGGHADRVSGEFWIGKGGEGTFGYNAECRIASSAAHIYGLGPVSAESFTSGHTFVNMPRDFKRFGDYSYTLGVNHVVFHVYLHQPYPEKPGISAWFGTDFNRHSTWFSEMGTYIDYVRRSCALLQSGENVADVAYFIGEDVPVMNVEKKPSLPDGYNFDYINAEVLMKHAKAKNGRLKLSTGPEYRILVLPDKSRMRPEVLEKIYELIRNGVAVAGPRPAMSPSLENYPECDRNVAELADKIWGDADGKTIKSRKVGKGMIFNGCSLDEIFGKLGIGKDVGAPEGVHFTHRKIGDAHVYFIANSLSVNIDDTLTFRTTGMQPELWNAVDGSMRPLHDYIMTGSHTKIPLHLGPTDSWFIVFRDKAGTRGSGIPNFPACDTVCTIGTEWKIDFQDCHGQVSVKWDELHDWSTNSDPDIRYYSGTAKYMTLFSFTPEPGKKYYLDLGTVETMASVEINGQYVTTLWRYPYSAEITDFLIDGENILKAGVTNTWWNRLVGDCVTGDDCGRWFSLGKSVRDPARESTNPAENIFATAPWKKDSKLMPSGLLGPVTILSDEDRTPGRN